MSEEHQQQQQATTESNTNSSSQQDQVRFFNIEHFLRNISNMHVFTKIINISTRLLFLSMKKTNNK